MSGWLEGFASRIQLSWLIFALPSLLVTLVAMVTVSVHTVRAAKSDPVKALRYE
jgi:putative ABC transport system permease protein